jgi:selenocysteine-specific elongation factor
VLERPIAAACGDRYVIRDVSARRTLGGGSIIDLRPPARRRRSPERRLQLAALALSDAQLSFKRLLETPPFAWSLVAFARDRALSPAEQNTLGEMPGIVMLGAADSAFAMATQCWRDYAARLHAALASYHQDNPDLQGIGRERLRLMLKPHLPADVFLAALRKLAEERAIVLESGFIRLVSHVVRLDGDDEATWREIAPMLSSDQRFRPPRVRDIAGALADDEREVRRLLKTCCRLGRVDEVAHDHFFLRSTVAEMAAIVAELGENGSVFSAAQFRDRVANGRKVAIQILEFFDRHGLTLRRGDRRRINVRRLDLFGAGALPSAQGRDSIAQ